MYTENYTDSEEVLEFTPEQKKLWDDMFVCRDEMISILHKRPMLIRNGFWDNEADITVASYLLSKVGEYNYPFGFTFDKLQNAGIDEDIIELARVFHIDESWNELLDLLYKYDPRLFRLNAILEGDNDDSDKTPEGIIEISKKLLDIQKDDRVADICCGTGSVAFSIREDYPDVDIDGFDCNPDAIAIAKVGAEVKNSNIAFKQLDVFNLAHSENAECLNLERYDKLFANYPFGLQLSRMEMGKQYKEDLGRRIPSISKATSSDWLFNMLLVDLLSENGKAIGVMTNGSTWNMIDTPIRQYFIENGLVESVIALPARLFNTTTIPTSLVVFSHGNDGVRLVDATNQFKPGRRRNELTEENIVKILEAVKTDSEISIFVPIDTLRENDYVLNSSRYLHSVNSLIDGVPFGSVIKRITRGAPLNADQLDALSSVLPTDKQYLMLSNIQDGMIDNDLPYISEIDSKLEKYCLTNHCLILSKNGYPYKVAVVEIEEGQKILANGNLYIIELNEEKVDPYYLAAFFSSETGTAFLKSITVGATIPNIGVEQLKKLLIPLPPFEKQKEISEKYQAAKDELSVLKLKVEKARNKVAHAYEEA